MEQCGDSLPTTLQEVANCSCHCLDGESISGRSIVEGQKSDFPQSSRDEG